MNSLVEVDVSISEPEPLRRQREQLGEETYQFVMGAVHDLRSAERGVATSAQLIQDLLGDSLRPEARPILVRLMESTEKANAILAAAAKYASALPAARYSFHAINASSLVRDALVGLELEIRNSGASIVHSELPEVWGDRDRLQELFQRLIDNSLKYHGPTPPRVEIAAQKGCAADKPDGVMFSVRDYGIGIPRKYQGELFRPFRRLHGPEVPGMGLGLVISRRIAETHGGRLWIDSDRGQGTTVFFTLPGPV
jgi:light-regulated signal transduction histidine kinase (bacteriophytochrome)